VRPLQVGTPATETEVLAVESELRLRLPESFRDVVLNFSSEVYWRWFLPDGTRPPETFRQIFSGECAWSLNRLVQLEENRQSWLKVCFPNVNDPYDAVWHNKLAFIEVGNGDLIALDLANSQEADTPVVYLSHEGDDFHGYQLGHNFSDFIERWSLLGCPGAEDWQMLPFTSSPQSCLEPYSENAVQWREWFGLKL